MKPGCRGVPVVDGPSRAAVQAAVPRASTADAALIEGLRRGDETVFARLVEGHDAALRRIARLYVSSPAIADEVVQDTWLAVIRGVWAFEGRSSLRTWILRILMNRAKTRAVAEGRTVPFAEVGLGDPESPAHRLAQTNSNGARDAHDPGPNPEARLLTREARARIRAAIEALPPNQRLVITMRDLEGYTTEEVCDVLGLTETNQRVILHRARSRVRAALAPYLRRE